MTRQHDDKTAKSRSGARRWLTERRRTLATLIIGIAIGTVVVSPASAHVGSNWTHLWGTHIKPAVLGLFYTKSQTNALYPTKSSLKNAGTVNYWNNPVAWSKLKGVPGGFADGSDDGWEIAAGTVSSAGVAQWGNNIYGYTSTWDSANGRYLINLPGQDYSWDTYTTVVTPVCSTADHWRATDDGGTPGKLVVEFYDNAGSTMQCSFQFLTY